MAVNLKGRSFLTLMDFSPQEIRYLLDLSHDLKARHRAGSKEKVLDGKEIVLLFEKTSTRTRCAFEVGAYQEGANITFLDSGSSQMGRKESLEDTARVLGRYYDGIEYRGYEQKTVEALAKYSGVPVWNGLTDVDHPTQILADMMTIEEHVARPLNQVRIAFVGDVRNNMCYAWMYGAAKMGMHFAGVGPEALYPDSKIMDEVQTVAKETGATIEIISDVNALKDVDVVYTDVWAGMGEESHLKERVALLDNYRVNSDLISKIAASDYIFMHCLPAYHDFETTFAQKARDEQGLDCREVSDEIFRSRHSVVFDEAENRMHTIKALMVATL
ncbi:ornithine carbamoyltransferase [Salmonella enterica subsp. diarizonae]|uniref:ornithine carbamoyltransferase n=1 Tax=Salmonella enterica TaxID=28901 RepID=UPI0009AC25F5|nr:ornithine carbamoyltransferase [Salmonella enterica]EAW2451566.1 ornithine carbamoyltransferase [Salmonella enterica subsp. diarizonae]EHG6070487.1 ornithine carbamoyltransferase [Salmonella enterica subsp. diarizonae serovar 61:z52:z53]ECI5214753.1 ornithine carbamoyltransferase [Salmonella enterica subsp. diarizonae]EDL8432110.1 ornithine carbamoyltransferase [Salmonella enterica subsp. diarizonae]EEI3023688.1 ornithine carbamoyltransferase [Salmonella enterica subsp. diarizonae]